MPDVTMNLGRKPEFDRRNLNFLGQEIDFGDARTVSWLHVGSVSDQNGWNGCVGWTGMDWRNTHPAKRAGVQYHDMDGLKYYNGATRNDQWSDNDRPDGDTSHDRDEGSSGLGLCKYFISIDVIDRYEWADNINRFLAMMLRGPMITGMEWTQDMFNPAPDGRVRPTGPVAGGHEILATRVTWKRLTPMESKVWFPNHWTNKWGKKGWFYLTVGDMIEQYKRGMDTALMIPKGVEI